MKNDYAAKERSERAERSLDSKERMVLTNRGLSVVHDLVDFAKETVKNRKQRKALRTDENESLLPETKTFNGMPLRDYCWLKDEIFRIKLKRRREEGGEGRRKHLTFFMQEWEKLDEKDVEEEES